MSFFSDHSVLIISFCAKPGQWSPKMSQKWKPKRLYCEQPYWTVIFDSHWCLQYTSYFGEVGVIAKCPQQQESPVAAKWGSFQSATKTHLLSLQGLGWWHRPPWMQTSTYQYYQSPLCNVSDVSNALNMTQTLFLLFSWSIPGSLRWTPSGPLAVAVLKASNVERSPRLIFLHQGTLSAHGMKSIHNVIT